MKSTALVRGGRSVVVAGLAAWSCAGAALAAAVNPPAPAGQRTARRAAIEKVSPVAGEGLPPYRLALAGFDLAKPAKVEIQCTRPVQTVVVRPSSLGIRPTVALTIIESPYNPSCERGRIGDIVFRNVRFDGKDVPPSVLTGFDDKHRVEGVVFENVQAGGRKWAKPEDGPMKTEFATGIEFR